LSLSVIADMALLMVLIWSFHRAYQQPPSFYLRAPTPLYVFIFIALHSLRFDARYVLLAGATAITGWSLLVLYAAAFETGGMSVTRDYVEYMTGNTILLGAEIRQANHHRPRHRYSGGRCGAGPGRAADGDFRGLGKAQPVPVLRQLCR
jgi:hypothetical protein